MEVKNLRIGNIVSFYGNNKPLTLKGLNTESKSGWKNGYIVDEKGDKTAIDCLKPIPLTENYLLKFGFYKSDINDSWNKDTGEDIFTLDSCLEFMSYEYAPLNYVHELQNLFFAITGEELSIKH